MSLDYLDQQIDAVRAKAALVQTSILNRMREIEKDPNLTQAGKKNAEDEIKDWARTEMTKFRAIEDQVIADKRSSLERTLFGSVGTDASSVISYRDAQDRAERIEDTDSAKTLLKRAQTSGDNILASAIARTALDRGWRSVYSEYGEDNSTMAEAAKDLARLEQFKQNGGMARAIAYMV